MAVGNRRCLAGRTRGGKAISFNTVSYAVRDGIALIELNRPDRHNAINSVMSRELPAVWRTFDADPSAIVAIVTGAGKKAFCTGADLTDLPELELDDQGTPLIDSISWTPLQNQVWKPVICAVNGRTIGGGLHFVADCDIVLASDDATFCDSHVSVGLVSGLEPVALARRMPMGAVLRMALMGTGEALTAQQACALGMVSEVREKSELLERAWSIAQCIKRNSPNAMAQTKRAIWGSKESGLTRASHEAWRMMVHHNETPDFLEGIRAFTEKREPRWTDYPGTHPGRTGNSANTPGQPDNRVKHPD